ncbi:MAG TPA: hypothetical protein VI432_00715 [Candidatus Paceibacterota bacterium]
MNLRDSNKVYSSKKNPWTIEQVEAGLRHFFDASGRYPTATEIDDYSFLPTNRTIERSFGGIIALRKKLRLGNEYDFRAGRHSSRRAHIINKRSNNLENEVYMYLCDKFHKEFVHREYLFTDDARTRADFFVYVHDNDFLVDVFCPSSLRNLTLCVNVKLKKYQNSPTLIGKTPLIFLQMNKSISQDKINEVLASKKRKYFLYKNQYVMDWDSFNKFCSSKKSLNKVISNKDRYVA